jgi:demethylmenaquinone methyltransferase/2-methoxy-6-polyprenyl-1,4-benzoquinol methylase
MSERNRHAERLFDGVAVQYEAVADVFSLFQYRRWHRFLVERLDLSPQSATLDICTGTGLVAERIAQRYGCPVLGLDLSRGMLARARTGKGNDGTSFVQARAENMPFPEASFDAVVFTFLLRYVDDPASAIKEMARVVRPGGLLASLEFAVPQGPLLHPLWLLLTRVALPLGARLVSPGWREAGSFLGPSISSFYKKHTVAEVEQMWRDAGISGVRSQRLSFGGAVITWGRKEADRGE